MQEVAQAGVVEAMAAGSLAPRDQVRLPLCRQLGRRRVDARQPRQLLQRQVLARGGERREQRQVDAVPVGGVRRRPRAPEAVVPGPEALRERVGIDLAGVRGDVLERVAHVDPHATALGEDRLDERLRHRGGREEGADVLLVVVRVGVDPDDATRALGVQVDGHRALADDEEDACRQQLRQPEDVLAGPRPGLVERVDHQHELLARPQPRGGVAEEAAQEVGTGRRGLGQDRLGALAGVAQVVRADQLRGEAHPGRRDPRLAGRELAEVVHPAAGGDQVGQQRGLAEAGRRLHDEVAARLLGQERVELGDQPVAADEALDVDAVEHLARVDVGLGQALVAADEERVAIAGDDQVGDHVATGGHPAAVCAHMGFAHGQRPESPRRRRAASTASSCTAG